MTGITRKAISSAICGSLRSKTVRSFKVMDVLRGANELQQKLNSEHATIQQSLVSGRTNAKTNEPKKVLHLEIGQPETGAPKPVANAAVEALTMPQASKDVMGYTDAFGILELREQIKQHYSDKYESSSGGGQNENHCYQVPDVSEIVVTTGSSSAFLLAFTACFDPDDTVAIASSGYPCYRNILQALGCGIATISINEEYKITAKELRQDIDRRTREYLPPIKGLILSSPSNPTGSMLSPLELRELCELCNEENIVFMSDEIYHGISYGNVPEATALQYAADENSNHTNENIIVINSFSKYYSMPGWRLGWMVVPPRFLQAINKLQQNMFISAPTISQNAALRCWDDDTTVELETHLTKYRANREIILSRFGSDKNRDKKSNNETQSVLEGLSLETNVAPADGGFYVYVDLGDDHVCMNNKEHKLDSIALCKQLLEQCYVAFVPGIDFEDPDCPKDLGRRRIRISYAGGTNSIRRAMDDFTEFWNTVWLPQIAEAKRDIGGGSFK